MVRHGNNSGIGVVTGAGRLRGNAKNEGNTANSTNSPSSSEGAAPAAKEVVTLKAYFPGDKPAGFDAVLQAVNDKLKKIISEPR